MKITESWYVNIEQCVAVQYKKILTLYLSRRLDDRSAGEEWGAFVRETHLDTSVAVVKVRHDLFVQVTCCEHHVCYSGISQSVKQIAQKRLAIYRCHWLGYVP